MEASVQTALGWAQIAPALPELILAGSALILLMVGVFRDERTSADIVTWGALLALALAGYAILEQPAGEQMAFGGAFVVDGFARFAKVLTLVAAGIVLFMASDSLREASIHKFEFPVLVLLATTGMLMMISAHSLIGLYVGLELQSLALYVIAAFRRDSVRSSEAGLKYFVLGALSSGLLLYGASLVYGFAGTVTFDGIAKAVSTGPVSLGLIFGLVFVLAGLAFKISAVPFHMWTPDVYEGAPTPVTAFFAGAPKVAALALLARVLLEAFPGIAIQWQQVITFIAIGSMVLGAFAAIGQNNIKRLMAYSSIGHVGFALVGIAAGSPDGVKGLLIYLVIYVAMTVGTFACIMAMRRADGPVEEIAALSGLARNDLPTAFLLAMLLFSLAGIPPLAGFFAKFYVFLAAIREGLYPLAVIGVLASVVSAYYYLRIIKVMFFDAPSDVFEPMPGRLRLVLTLASLFVLFYVVYPAPLVSAAEAAARTLFP